jgi:hypothetical protein
MRAHHRPSLNAVDMKLERGYAPALCSQVTRDPIETGGSPTLFSADLIADAPDRVDQRAIEAGINLFPEVIDVDIDDVRHRIGA